MVFLRLFLVRYVVKYRRPLCFWSNLFYARWMFGWQEAGIGIGGGVGGLVKKGGGGFFVQSKQAPTST